MSMEVCVHAYPYAGPGPDGLSSLLSLLVSGAPFAFFHRSSQECREWQRAPEHHAQCPHLNWKRFPHPCRFGMYPEQHDPPCPLMHSGELNFLADARHTRSR
eukprot:2372119-Rhodomonas_salina.3